MNGEPLPLCGTARSGVLQGLGPPWCYVETGSCPCVSFLAGASPGALPAGSTLFPQCVSACGGEPPKCVIWSVRGPSETLCLEVFKAQTSVETHPHEVFSVLSSGSKLSGALFAGGVECAAGVGLCQAGVWCSGHVQNDRRVQLQHCKQSLFQ